MSIVDALFSFLFYYLLFFSAYFLIFSLAAKLKRPKKITTYQKNKGLFAVLIPAYKEDIVIVPVIQATISHNYPADKFDIIVMGDSLAPATLAVLNTLPILVLLASTGLRSKGKAINLALQKLNKAYDFIMILDADNIMETDCLNKMNERLQQGILVVQGHRKAKNRNNPIAILDSLSEEVNNSIFRSGHRALGLSAALIGSGMSFHYHYYKQMMLGIENIWEDRELEFRILKDRKLIEYADDAIIYDEKVSNSYVFMHQRSKWLAGQFRYFRKYAFSNWKTGFTGNKNLLDKLLQTMSPPRSIALGLLTLSFLLSFLIKTGIASLHWGILLFFYLLALFLAIPADLLNKNFRKAILNLPVALLLMFLALWKALFSKKVDFNTPHTFKEIK